MDKEQIENRVFMENEINRILNEEVPKILEQIKPFLNEKVVNQTGQLTKKFKDTIKLNNDIKAIPLKDGYVSIHFNFITCQYDYLKYKFGLCFSGGDLDKDSIGRRNNPRYKNTYYCVYVDKEIYLSSQLEKGFILKGLEDFKPYPFINAEEQFNQIIKVRNLKEELSREENKIYYCLRGFV